MILHKKDPQFRFHFLEIPDFLNQGEECWNMCGGHQNTQCNSCGKKGLCCRQGVVKNECDGVIGGERRHECSKAETEGNRNP